MKNTLALFTISIFLASCNSEKNNEGKLYALTALQSATKDQYYFGSEKLSTLNEYTQDKSAGLKFYSRSKKIFRSASKIDSCAGEMIFLIESLKIDLFKQLGENIILNSNSTILSKRYNKQDPSNPCTFNFSKVKHTGTGTVFNAHNKDKFVASIRTFRKQICEQLESSNNIRNSKEIYFFKDPAINNYKDQKDFNQLFDKALKNSNVSLDDLDAIRTIYQLLSKTDKEWEGIMSEQHSWMDAISVLLSIESSVLQARSLALSVINSRIGFCANYGFTKILPIVNGPSLAFPGDTIELQVLTAAINEDKNPILTISGGKLTRTENGIGYVKVVVPNASEINVAGKLSILNKSGIPLTLPWSRKITIMEKKKSR